MQKLMSGRKGLILGVANESSIAWAIAKTLHEQGAELAFTYQNEKTLQYTKGLFESVNSTFYRPLDVVDEIDIHALITELSEHFNGVLDFIVHSVAGGPKRGELEGRFIETSREGFLDSIAISVYSLNAIVREALPLLQASDNASVLTMSYYGSEKVVTNYNVMGVAKAALEADVRYLAADLGRDRIRVNALSPGTLRTRAASGIGDFNRLVDYTASHAPLHRNATVEEVASAGLFLLSPMSSGMTGEILYVDAGYHHIGVDLD